MLRALSPTTTLVLLFGASSLTAVGLGAWICDLHEVPVALWGRNLAAWGFGALIAAGLSRLQSAGSPACAFGALILSAAALAASLFDPGQLGVHRWLRLGPLAMNAAMLTLPAAVVALARLAPERPWIWAAALGGLALLVLQPDASQATAFGAANAGLALWAARALALRAAVLVGVAALAAAAWLRPDPLAPVPEVEDILDLATQVSPALAVAAFVAVVLAALAPAWSGRRASGQARSPALALSLYLVVSALTPFLGAYPVPLVGVGLSPILGAWLGVGLLAGTLRAGAPSADHRP
jgi:hypothetical protein